MLLDKKEYKNNLGLSINSIITHECTLVNWNPIIKELEDTSIVTCILHLVTYKSYCSITITTFQLETSIFARLSWLNKSSYEDFFFGICNLWSYFIY